MIYLDTHVVAWLFAGKLDLFPEGARRRLEESDLLISPMVALELEYLFEIQRTTEPAPVVIDELQRKIGLKVCDLPFPAVITEAQRQRWTRDPFDRVITGHAALRKLPLMTKDEIIREHYSHAVWAA